MGSNRIEEVLNTGTSAKAAGSTDAVELSLYDELMAFTVLTPEQQEADARQRESESAHPATQPEEEEGLIESIEHEQATEQPEPAAEPAPAPLPVEPARSVFSSVSMTRAATISVYKSTVRPDERASSDQGFIVLDAQELLSEVEADTSYDDPADTDTEASIEASVSPSETLSETGPLDVKTLHNSEERHTTAVCGLCGYESDGGDLLCLGCGSLLEGSKSNG
ncbi:MAG TPA: hypothetical protein VLD57_07850 [Blastocatellia bacterium]|nr:hypothetical protein [Blastocatellia bacterium]